jgi:hypothetical protein
MLYDSVTNVEHYVKLKYGKMYLKHLLGGYDCIKEPKNE